MQETQDNLAFLSHQKAAKAQKEKLTVKVEFERRLQQMVNQKQGEEAEKYAALLEDAAAFAVKEAASPAFKKDALAWAIAGLKDPKSQGKDPVLAVYEKFGWAGGIIMGPIETFGLLANTLSYLRVMGVGVAGVKIAEVSITMGFDLMVTTSNPALMVVGLLLFLFIQAFALALGILSPSIHAARLHFVEWMGKFYSGTGRVFTPIGGRTLHTEGQS